MRKRKKDIEPVSDENLEGLVNALLKMGVIAYSPVILMGLIIAGGLGALIAWLIWGK